MITDELNEFADAASIAAAAGTALIGDVIDLGANHRDIGIGQPMWLVISVDTDIVAAGAGTVKFILASDAQAAIATDGSATVHYDSGTMATAATTPAGQKAGKTLVATMLPSEGNVYERYLGILCTIATQTISAGKINAYLTPDLGKVLLYADGAQ